MPKVILVKQGETDYDRENRFQGSRDLPLNESGKSSAKKIADKLKEEAFKAVYTSPAAASLETARIISEAAGAEIVIDERLKDISLGRWEALTPDEAKRGYPIFFAKWERDPTSVTPPGGENIIHSLQRISRFWFEKISREKDTVVIVTSKITGALLRLYVQSGFDESEAKKRSRKLWKLFPEITEIEELDTA